MVGIFERFCKNRLTNNFKRDTLYISRATFARSTPNVPERTPYEDHRFPPAGLRSGDRAHLHHRRPGPGPGRPPIGHHQQDQGLTGAVGTDCTSCSRCQIPRVMPYPHPPFAPTRATAFFYCYIFEMDLN